MKNLINISQLDQDDFTTILSLKKELSLENIETWANLPFLRRSIIITKDDQTGFELWEYLSSNKELLGLAGKPITLRENYLCRPVKKNLTVETKVDMHFENKLVSSPTEELMLQEMRISTENPGYPPSPTITVNTVED